MSDDFVKTSESLFDFDPVTDPIIDTTMVDALSAADSEEFEKINLESMKQEIQDSGIPCIKIPGMTTKKPIQKYARDFDIIAVLQDHILDIEIHLEKLELQKKALEIELRCEVEKRAEDPLSKLTNDKKRQLEYEVLALNNDEFQRLSGEIRIFNHQIKKRIIELENEERAFDSKYRICGVKCQ